LERRTIFQPTAPRTIEDPRLREGARNMRMIDETA
jgi:hypothetical protein